MVGLWVVVFGWVWWFMVDLVMLVVDFMVWLLCVWLWCKVCASAGGGSGLVEIV